MKLVLATPLYPPELGGPATYAKLLAEHLPEVGCEVVVVKFSAVRSMPKFIRHISYYFRVLKAARHADMVLALDPVSTGFPALLAARTLGKPFVVKIVGDFAWEQGRQRFGVTQSLDDFVQRKQRSFPITFLQSIQAYVARRAQHIIVPSEYLKHIVEKWSIPEMKITVINNAIVAESTDQLPALIKHLKKPWVLSVGRMVPWKGFDGLIDAVAIVRKEIPGLGLALVGEGPGRASLEARAKEVLTDNFLFTGTYSHEETFSTMAAADLFVLNSTYEGLSHVLVEATLCGKPIIATNAGGNKEVITDEENGLLIAPERPDLLAEAMRRMLTNDELRERLGKHAQESSVRFQVPSMIKKTNALLAAVIKEYS